MLLGYGLAVACIAQRVLGDLWGELAALLGEDDYTELAHYQGLVGRLNDIITGDTRVCNATQLYILTTNGRFAPEGPITYHHRDEFIQMVAEQNLAPVGRGFGVAAPEDIAEADPLGLRFVAGTETLRSDVIIIDPDAVNEDPDLTDAPVDTGINNNTCKTPGGLDKTNVNLWVTVGSELRYQLWSNMDCLDEAGGNRVRLFDDLDKDVTVYVRESDAHAITRQLFLGKPAVGDHPKRITIRGYPTDAMPVIPCSSEITFGATDTIAGVSGDSGQAAAAIRIGANASQGRQDLHFRWLHFVGHRHVADYNGVEGEVFANVIVWLNVAGNDRISFRFCDFTGWQPIEDGNADAGEFPEYVDIAFHDRDDNVLFIAIFNRSNNCSIEHCHFKAADLDIPFANYAGDDYDAVAPSNNTLGGRGVRNEGGNNFTLAYCTFEGFCAGDYVGVVARSAQPNVTGMWIHHNLVASNGYKCFLAREGEDESIAGVVEYNWFYNAGTENLLNTAGTNAEVAGADITFRYNVVANGVDSQVQRAGLTFSGFGAGTRNSGGVFEPLGVVMDIHGNIFYNARVVIGNGADLASAGDVDFHGNIVYGVQEPTKGDDDRDAPVSVEATQATGLGNNRVRGNGIFRDPNDADNPTVMFLHVYSGGFTQYGADAVFAGLEDNVYADPQFADPATGDFTVGNAAFAELVRLAPKTRAAVGAWTPPE